MKRTLQTVLLMLTIAFIISGSYPFLSGTLLAQASSAAITKTELSLYEGHTSPLQVKGVSGKITWSSSNKTIASVSSKGKVTGKKSGTAIITAKNGNKKYKCKVTVLKIKLNKTEATLYIDNVIILELNDKKTTATWSSDHKSIAVVDKRGIVTAIKPGTATITGKISDTLSVNCIITVTNDPSIPTKLDLVNVPTSMVAGEKQKISVNYFPSSSAGSEIHWEIEDENGYSNCLPFRFDENTMTIEALSSGIACIRAVSFLDESVYDEFYIEVSNPIPGSEIRNTDEPEDGNPDSGQSTTPANKPKKPIVKTSDAFRISQDSSIILFDAPYIKMTTEDFDYWDEMYYTLDGSTPTRNSSRCYLDTHINVTDKSVLKMIGVSADSTNEVLTVHFTVRSGVFTWGYSELDIDSCLYVMKNCPTEADTLLNAREQELCIKANAILASIITPGMTDYDKLKAVHDYMCSNITYAHNYAPDSENAYGALINGTCVCGGYADAYHLLMSLCDVQCIVIHGSAVGEGHAWNLVKLDNEWYHVDCTWDDTDNEYVKIYGYFLIDDNKMSTVHSWTRTSWVEQGITCSWPVCSNSKYVNAIIY